MTPLDENENEKPIESLGLRAVIVAESAAEVAM